MIIPRVSNRCLFCCFGLAGIVINSSYKNDNIYRMALPRKEIYLETFNDLLANNFTILTRSSNVILQTGFVITKKYSGIQILFNSHSVRDVGFRYLTITSEISDLMLSSGWQEAKDGISYMLQRKTNLHPRLFELFKTIAVQNINHSWAWTVPMWNDHSEHLKKLFWKQEEEMLENELKTCKNVAVLVP